MNVFDTMQVISSGLSAERVRINVTTSNLANAQTTRTEEGGPYQRRDPIFQSSPMQSGSFSASLNDAMQSVLVPEIVKDQDPPRLVFDPSHPDADDEGYVSMPNVNMVEEMVNMMQASRSYDANITALRDVMDMAEKALGIGR
jgi:flagellar basal-body rod protein FlgC